MEINLKTEPYLSQLSRWPGEGKHILAQSSDEHIVVYQAYRPSTGEFAAEHQYFDKDFSYSRMSWIKPNFLWMMYRSGWGTKPNQEVTLAIYLKRDFFFRILENAFPSSNAQSLSKEQWSAKIAETDVRLQWDPDHDPYGAKQARKAIQLGLRNDFLAPFKGEGIVKIEDISGFVKTQREHVNNKDLNSLVTPTEHVLDIPQSLQASLGMGG